jgi:release factor glutamine methyltransferase
LIPRQETEELVFWALETLEGMLGSKYEKGRVIDFGTGSGCIPVVLAKKWPSLDVFAVDIDKAALELAQKNAERHRVSVSFQQLNMLDMKDWAPKAQFNMVISNPPYIPISEKPLVPAHVDKFEPHLALYVDDNDPLVFYKAIAKIAKTILAPQGALLFECNEFNASKVKQLLDSELFINVELKLDINNSPRMVRGFLPG